VSSPLKPGDTLSRIITTSGHLRWLKILSVPIIDPARHYSFIRRPQTAGKGGINVPPGILLFLWWDIQEALEVRDDAGQEAVLVETVAAGAAHPAFQIERTLGCGLKGHRNGEVGLERSATS
jgi:hypothetical protein